MRKQLAVWLAASAALVTLSAQPARAEVLTFDDLATSDYIYLSSPYHGLTWNNFGVINGCTHAPDSGYCSGIVSGANSLFNWSGQPAEVIEATSSSLFDFNSAYLTAVWNDGAQFHVGGFLGSTELYSRTVRLTTSGPQLFTFDFLGINGLKLQNVDGGDWFAMDDMSINETAPVPEPASLLLLGTGVASLVRRYRHRKSNA